MTTNRTRARWMGFTAPEPVHTPAPAAPALSARQAAVVDEYDAVMLRAPHVTARDLIPVFQGYINLPAASVAAYRAARG